MDLVTDLLAPLAGLPFPLVLAVAGALVLAECTLGLGFLVPGEAALLVAATTATSVPRAALLWAVVTACAVVGDAVGYAVGRRCGPRLARSRVVARAGAGGWERATGLLRRRGAWAVVGARFLPVVRTLTPAAAGASGLPVRRFALASLTGAAAWSAVHVALGSGAVGAAEQIQAALGTAGLVGVALLVAAAVVAVLVVRARVRQAGVTPAGVTRDRADVLRSEPCPEGAARTSVGSREHDGAGVR
ncbi:DedA family protein [Kineococcus glutinatus]|uniref:VTT domain-containing protein n=1 Tax=Kineococcus glutinatus TaxID=1070872 RepID=A0ABP8VIL9_9ACTN